MLQRISATELAERLLGRNKNDEGLLRHEVQQIVDAVKNHGLHAVCSFGAKFGDIPPYAPEPLPPITAVLISKQQLSAAWSEISAEKKEALSNALERIQAFALAQKQSLSEIRFPVAGGVVGHELLPVETAGCYAPGGRYSLPSSVLMTVGTARIAGVDKVILASPRPTKVTLAAAYLAGADGVLTIGGPAAIAALAYGAPPLIPPCDVVVGPGNKYVTEAKHQISKCVRIDLLAGPSEVFVIADKTADARTVACDLIAQAEHDVDASAVLITNCASLAEEVPGHITNILQQLPPENSAIASESLMRNSGIVLVDHLATDGLALINDHAPEHVEIMAEDSGMLRSFIRHAGAVFEGHGAAEVFCDYGMGPNHTLPTSRAARFRGGLSVFDFLRIRTFSKVTTIGDPGGYGDLIQDTILLAGCEGLAGHALSAKERESVAKRGGIVGEASNLSSVLRIDANLLMKYHPVMPLEAIAAQIGLPLCRIRKLNGNENPYGPPKGLGEYLAKRLQNEAWMYPDPDQRELRNLLSKYTRLPVDQIVCGAGADDLIQLVIQIVRPDGVVICGPTFAMYEFFSRINRTPTYHYNLFQTEVIQPTQIDDIVRLVNKTNSSAVFIASPNNPTGTWVPWCRVIQLCRSLIGKAFVILDQAYVEFSSAETYPMDLLQSLSNLCILRTFSKWAGLAGLRCGYALSSKGMIERLMQIKIPYNLNLAASAAGCYALQHEKEILKTVKALVEMKNHLTFVINYSPLRSHMKAWQSEANFVYCEICGGFEDAAALHAELWNQGILTRKYTAPARKSFIRISSGKPNDVRNVLQALRKYFHLASPVSTKPAAILWDMDGVLADVSQSYHEAILETCRFFGAEDVEAMQIYELKGVGGFNNDWELTRELIRQKTRTDVPLADVVKEFQKFYDRLCDLEELLVSAEELRWLGITQQITMGIVTGRPRAEALRFLQRHRISDLFQVVVCHEDTVEQKPNPAPLLKALQHLKSLPERGLLRIPSGVVLYFGDTVDDMKCAASVNHEGFTVVPIGLVPRYHPKPYEAASSLYSNGANVVGCRWDCITVLGVPIVPGDDDLPEAPPAETSAAAPEGGSGTHGSKPEVDGPITQKKRTGKAQRKTRETKIECQICLDGDGNADVGTGIGFLDHMISQLATHGSFDILLHCVGDLHVDDHHSVEDCAIVLGDAINEALGDKRGIQRFGYAYAPLDEALSRAVVDLSGRPFASMDLSLTRDKIGSLSAEMVPHFFSSLAIHMKGSVHLDCLKGLNAHHQVESLFKAFALAMRSAVAHSKDQQTVPSTKGVL